MKLSIWSLAVVSVIARPTPMLAWQEPEARFPLQAEIENMIAGTGTGSEWGVLAVSLESGDTLVAVGPDRALSPASNQKLLTTAAALHHLGPEFRFATYLLTRGNVSAGVLRGDVILYGTGDPAISERFFRSSTDPLRTLARELVAQGIHTVAGDVVGDGGFFEGPTRLEAWPGQDNPYAAAVSALTFNENYVTIRVAAGSLGESAGLFTEPEGLDFELINRTRTVAADPRPALFLIRDEPDDPIELRGEMTVGQPDIWRELTVPDPVSFAAAVFRQVLEEEGIRVLGGARPLEEHDRSAVTGQRLVAPAFDLESDRVRTIAVHYSPPLHELLAVMNHESNNLYSELLLFTLGRLTRGHGSFEGGSAALEDHLVRVAGIREGDLHVEDGSGLSRDNRATASAFVTLMTQVAESDYAETFWASLPQAGNRLELARMYQSPAAGNLRAKTGTIQRVSALTGVVRSAAGEAILFSIVSNGVRSSSTAKWIEDRIGIRLASYDATLPPAADRVALVEYGEFGPRVLPAPRPSVSNTGSPVDP